MAQENPRWGYLRHRGRLPEAGGYRFRRRAFATSCAVTGLRPAPRTSGPSWSQFLSAQAAGTLACDFFHVDTVTLRRLYVLFFIDLERRKVFFGRAATAHPVGAWVTQQARDLAATLDDQGRAIAIHSPGPGRQVCRPPSTRWWRSTGCPGRANPCPLSRANAFAEPF